MKKTVALLLLLALTLSFTACGSEEVPVGDLTSAEQTSVPAVSDETTSEPSEALSEGPEEPSEEPEETQEPSDEPEEPSDEPEEPSAPEETEPSAETEASSDEPEEPAKSEEPSKPAKPSEPSEPSEPPPHTHSYTSQVTKKATCTADGVETFTCSCGDAYTKVLKATGHDWGEWFTAREPTIENEGVSKRNCWNWCGASETKSIPKLLREDVVPEAAVRKIETYFFELVNQERVKNGLDPLRSSAYLNNAAKIRSEELLLRYSHTRPDGTLFDTVIDPFEYDYFEIGENCCGGVYHIGPAAYNGRDDVWVCSDEQLRDLAYYFFEAFVNSPGHYKNMMKPTYTECGVGVSWFMDEGYYNLPCFYIDHIFARPATDDYY